MLIPFDVLLPNPIFKTEEAADHREARQPPSD